MTKRVKYLIIYLSIMIALTLVRISAGEGYLGDGVMVDNMFTILAQILCMGMIPVFSMIVIDKNDGLEVIRERLYFKKPRVKGSWWWVLLIAILHIVVNGGISTVWYNFIRLIGYTPVVSDGEVIKNVGEFIFALLMSAVLPAFFEEITHRGLVLHVSRGNAHKRALLSALLFALMHQNITQTGYTFAGGLIMAYTVIYTGSIFPAMVIHFVNNALVQLRIFSSSYNGLVYQGYEFIFANMSQWWFMLILVIIWALAVVGVYFSLKRLKSKSEDGEVYVMEVEQEEGDKTVSKFLWISIIVFGALTTLYTFVWGVIR